MKSRLFTLPIFCAFVTCTVTLRALGDEAFNRGVQLYQAKDFEGAVNSFRKSKNKSSPVLHYYLANSYASLNRIHDAATEYTTCSLLHPDRQTADLCNQALKQISALPEIPAAVAPAKKQAQSKGASASNKPTKLSAMEWANTPDTPAGNAPKKKMSGLDWANTPGTQAGTKQKKMSGIEWANTPNNAGAGVARTNVAPSDDARASFDQRVQSQLQERKAELEPQKAKSKELLDKAASEAADIKKQAKSDEDALSTYGRRGRYYRGQASEDIKEDAEMRSKDVLQRAKAEAQTNSKAAQERERALDSTMKDLRAQMRGGRGRLDPSDSNLYVRNYK
jgi:hypothetical protein